MYLAANEWGMIDDSLIQSEIMRVISRQTRSFNYNQIKNEVHDELRKKGMSENMLDSYYLNDMIKSSLDQMRQIGRITSVDHNYAPGIKRIRPKVPAYRIKRGAHAGSKLYSVVRKSANKKSGNCFQQ